MSLDRWLDIRGGETLKSPHLATHLLVPACQQLWPVEHHGLESTLHLAINRTLDLLVPDRLVLLAVAVLVCTFTTGVASEVPLSPKLSTNP